MKIVTHSGHFHADELMALATLLLKFKDQKIDIIRSRDEDAINSADIVVDVGYIYDPSKLRFDHHQPEGAGLRDNNIPYASFGLVWREFGKDICGGVEEAQVIEDKLVAPIDANDNGVSICSLFVENVREYTIGDFFESYALSSKTMEECDKAFFTALPMAVELLEREIKSAKTKVGEWKKVKEIYDNSVDKRIIVLPESLSWKKILVPLEAHFVVYPRTDGNWGAQSVAKEVGSFDRKSSFPESWAGLKDGDLAKVSGVQDAVFCHKGRWLANAKSREGAISLAKKALDA